MIDKNIIEIRKKGKSCRDMRKKISMNKFINYVGGLTFLQWKIDLYTSFPIYFYENGHSHSPAKSNPDIYDFAEDCLVFLGLFTIRVARFNKILIFTFICLG